MNLQRLLLVVSFVLLSACSDSAGRKSEYPAEPEPHLITLDSAGEHSTRNHERICVIGIDALTWDILGPLMEQGELPNFTRMIRDGGAGILDTADPHMYSPRIWTTVATGKVPEKHGIEFFLINPHGARQSGKTAGSDLRKCLAIWNIASHFNKRVLVSNWMVTWPAEPVLGTIISDYLELDHGVYPDVHQHRLKTEYFNSAKRSLHHGRIYQRFFPWFEGPQSANLLSRGEQIKLNNLLTLIYRDEFSLNASLQLLEDDMPDLSMLYLRSVDIASHFYWKYSQLRHDDPRLKGLEQGIERFGNLLPEIYRWADEQLGRIVDVFPDDTTFIVLSDHGFRTFFNDLRGYNLMKILREMNCAYTTENSHMLPVVADTSDPIEPTRRLHIIEDRFVRYSEATGKTRDQLKNDITQTLLSIRTETGIPLFTREPVDNLPLAESDTKPDLAFTFSTADIRSDDTLVISDKRISIETYIQFLEQSGNHDPKAVIIVSGKNARKNNVIENAATADIVPTILTLFDLPVADDMDGKPILSALDPAFPEQHPLTRIATYEDVIQRIVTEAQVRPDIIEELKAIGYIQ